MTIHQNRCIMKEVRLENIRLDYCTKAGKNVILSYVEKLSANEQLEIYDIREEIEANGFDAFEKINTRHIQSKLWEIKSKSNRIMYVIIDSENVKFIHIFKKEKNKTEKSDIDIAMRRAKKEGLI